MPVKYSTWAITVRPRTGITNDQIRGITAWIDRICDYYYIITEKDGFERHLHAAMFLKGEDHRSNLNNRLLALACMKRSLNDDELRVQREGTKIMYDWNFINSYLKKEDGFHKDIARKLPPQEQWEVIGLQRFPENDDRRAARAFEGDPWMLKMEELFKEWLDGTERQRDGSHAIPNFDGGYTQWQQLYIDTEHHNTLCTAEEAEQVVSRFYHTMMYAPRDDGGRRVKVERDPRRVKHNIVAMLKFFTSFTGAWHARGIPNESAMSKAEQRKLDRMSEAS